MALTALKVKNAKPGRHVDGRGLPLRAVTGLSLGICAISFTLSEARELDYLVERKPF